MTEQDIVDLGATKELYDDGESFYFIEICENAETMYMYSHNNGLPKDEWYMMYGGSDKFKFYDIEDVKTILDIFKRNHHSVSERNYKLNKILKDEKIHS